MGDMLHSPAAHWRGGAAVGRRQRKGALCLCAFACLCLLGSVSAGRAAEGDGGEGPPAWARAVPVGEWYELKGTRYRDAIAKLAPSGKYLGYDPIGATVDAYCDPVANKDNSAVFFFGGGHNGGTLNGLFKFDTITLTYSMVIPPTPPEKYPPSYSARGGISYPSGATPGYFSTKLTDPADLPYKPPQDAPNTSHMYTASDMRGEVIYYFYRGYKCADTRAGRWEQLGTVDIGEMLSKLTPDRRYGAAPLQQGTAAVYDEVTDRFLVTMVPGDAGINGRANRLLLWDPVKHAIDLSGPKDGLVPMSTRSSMNLFKVGRWAYALMCKPPAKLTDDPDNFGFRYNFDTSKIEAFKIVGDLFKFKPTSRQETVPCVYHPGKNCLVRWNYGENPNVLYTVSLEPSGGAGTNEDPYILKQTKVELKGSLNSPPVLNYRRMYYNARTGVMLFLPSSKSNWYAVRL